MTTTTTPNINPRYLTLEQAGQYFGGLSSNAIRHMARAGRLPVYKFGKRLFVAVKDIEETMSACRISDTIPS